MKDTLIAELRTNREMGAVAMAEWLSAKREATRAEVNDRLYGVGGENTKELKTRARELKAHRDALRAKGRELEAKICVCIAVNTDTEYRDDTVDDLYKTLVVDGVDRKELSEEMEEALVDYVNIHVMELDDI